MKIESHLKSDLFLCHFVLHCLHLLSCLENVTNNLYQREKYFELQINNNLPKLYSWNPWCHSYLRNVTYEIKTFVVHTFSLVWWRLNPIWSLTCSCTTLCCIAFTLCLVYKLLQIICTKGKNILNYRLKVSCQNYVIEILDVIHI